MSNNPFSTPDPNNPPPNQGQAGPHEPSYGQQPDYGPSQGSKYGTEAYQPGSHGGPLDKPKEYGLLLTMTLVLFGLDLVSSLLGLIPAFSGDLEVVMREEMEATGATGAEIDTAIGLVTAVAGILALIVLVISIGLYLLVYFGLRAKKNWARITGIVLGIIGVLFSLGSLVTALDTAFASPLMTVSTVLGLVWVAAAVYWLILAFNSKVAGYLQQPQQA